MKSIDFFYGIREQPPFTLLFHGGKAGLECSIIEGWGQIIVHSLKCGDKYERTLKRIIGIVYTEKEDLESLVSGSIGLKGVASLDGQLSAKAGIELQLTRSEEIEDKFIFDAPVCGEKTVATYQFYRRISLRYRDSRPFRKKDLAMDATCWSDIFYNDTHVFNFIPECGCKTVEPEPDGRRVFIEMDRVTMTTDYFQFDDNIKIPELDLEVEKSKLHQPIQLSKSRLPRYLVFLAGGIPDIVNANLSFETTTLSNLATLHDLDIKQDDRTELIESLSDEIKEQLLSAAYRIENNFTRARVFAFLMPHLNDELKTQVLSDVRKIENEYIRTRAFAAFAPFLNVELQTQLISDARTIQNEAARGQVLTALAPYLNARLKSESESAAHEIQDEWVRERTLSALSTQHGKERKTEALTFANEINDESFRIKVLVALAPYLSDELKSTLQKVLAVNLELDEQQRIDALTEALVQFLSKRK